MTTYALDNHHAAATAHHDNLAELFDPDTRARVQDLPQWPQIKRAVDVGAGGGSVSRWLADQLAGRGGTVVAVDVKPEPIAPHPALRVVGHDLSGGQPLPSVIGDGYDLVVSRMTLIHLANREQVLREFSQLLAPGGVVVVQDWVPISDDMVVAAPTPQAADLYCRYQRAVQQVFAASGADPTWGKRAYRAMCDAGLSDVRTSYTGSYWHGGGPGLRVVATTARQLRPRLIEAGLTDQDLDQFTELVEDPQLIIHGHPLYTTTGVRN